MKKKYAFVLDVPEIEKEAYDHDRPISGLVHNQLVHLSAAEQTLAPKQRTNINISNLHTEREASDYIHKVTAKLHLPRQRKKRTASKTEQHSSKLRKKKSGRKTS